MQKTTQHPRAMPTIYTATQPCSMEGFRKVYADAIHRKSQLLSLPENGGKHTINPLRGICNIGDTDVTPEDENERDEMDPWARFAIGKENLEKREDGVERMLSEVLPA